MQVITYHAINPRYHTIVRTLIDMARLAANNNSAYVLWIAQAGARITTNNTPLCETVFVDAKGNPLTAAQALSLWSSTLAEWQQRANREQPPPKPVQAPLW